MAGQVAVIRLTVGELRREWCDRCLTSAALVLPILAITDAGVSTVSEARGCTRCDPGLRSGQYLIATWEAEDD